MKIRMLSEIISGSEARLGVFYVRGEQALARRIGKPGIYRYKTGETLPGHAFIIVSPESMRHLRQRPPGETILFLKQLAERNNPLLIFSEKYAPSKDLIAYCSDNSILLFISTYDAYLLESRLTGLIREKWDGVQMIHASLVAVNDRGILLVGEAGSGKTSCAINLAQRGHRWVADDAVILKRRWPHGIEGYAHQAIRDLVNLRGRGILRVAECVTGVSFKNSVRIRLIAQLRIPEPEQQRIQPSADTRMIMGVAVPHVELTYRHNANSVVSNLLEIVHNC